MKKLSYSVLIFILIVFSGSILFAANTLPSSTTSPIPSAAAATPTPVPSITSTPTPTLNSLLIETEQYSYKVTEPLKWRGFTADAAKYLVDVYLAMDKYTFSDSPAIMYVKTQKKSGYSAKQHLAWDIDDLKSRNDGIQINDLRVGEMYYEYAARVYQADMKHINYLCYVDPGPNEPYYLVFTLSGAKEICDNNKEIFIFLLKSFWWMGSRY